MQTSMIADDPKRLAGTHDNGRGTTQTTEDSLPTTGAGVASASQYSNSRCGGKGGNGTSLCHQGNTDFENIDATKEHFHTASSCPICLADFQPKEMISSCKDATSCKHVFHTECLQMWLFKHESCPICRFRIVPPPAPQHFPVALVAVPAPNGPPAAFQ